MSRRFACLAGFGKFPLFMLALLFSAAAFFPAKAETYFKADPDCFRFGNGNLERVFTRQGDIWRTTWLVNKISGHAWKADSREFRIRFTCERVGYWPGLENPLVIGADDCIFRGWRVSRPAISIISLSRSRMAGANTRR